MDGILIIDKPDGWTSFDVCAKLRGVLKQKRVGHGGTLDPMATGVLPVFIGRATRAVEFFESADKEYIAGLRLGIVTDTQDITGQITNTYEKAATFDELRAALPRFLGRQEQIPPMYSAVKQDGKKLYELARRGVEVERKARDIEIFSIEVVETPMDSIVIAGLKNDFYIKVACSKGTYIRTLVHDIGQVLGCGAALSYLRRTKAGSFTIDTAHPLDDIIKAATNSDFTHLLPVDTVFMQYPAVTLNAADTKLAKNGALRRVQDAAADGKYRFYSQEGEFLMLGEVRSGGVKTIKTFFEV